MDMFAQDYQVAVTVYVMQDLRRLGANMNYLHEIQIRIERGWTKGL